MRGRRCCRHTRWRKEKIPVRVVGIGIFCQLRSEGSVKTFDLPVGLGMVSDRKCMGNVEGSSDSVEKVIVKVCAVIRDEPFRRAMKENERIEEK